MLLEHGLLPLARLVQPVERPPALERHEHLDRVVDVQRGAVAVLRTDQPEAEIRVVEDRGPMRRVLVHARPDDLEDVPLMALDHAIEEGLAGRLQVPEASDPLVEHSLLADADRLGHDAAPFPL